MGRTLTHSYGEHPGQVRLRSVPAGSAVTRARADEAFWREHGRAAAGQPRPRPLPRQALGSHTSIHQTTRSPHLVCSLCEWESASLLARPLAPGGAHQFKTHNQTRLPTNAAPPVSFWGETGTVNVGSVCAQDGRGDTSFPRHAHTTHT